MSKLVVTKIEYSYGSVTGNVNYLSVSTGWALDSEDLDSLKSDFTEQLRSRDKIIEVLEEKVRKIEQENNLLVSIFKESICRIERDNASLARSIINISKETREQVLQMLSRQ